MRGPAKQAPPEVFRLPGDDSLFSNLPEEDSLAGVPAVKAIAFYLPQYHPIPENDAWWGEGFTDWVNVQRGRPCATGHYQPHVPHEDLGYYDLSDDTVMENQVKMAQNAGIYGFCFYYYWFGGKRLLEMPLERFLKSAQPDFPFCVCWANENWSRRWDGQDHEILISQKHTEKDDLNFIQNLLPVLQDSRYIRVDGRPLILVYRPALLPHPRKTFESWRAVCRREGLGEIHLAGVASFNMGNPHWLGLDAIVEFPPNESQVAPLCKKKYKPVRDFKGNFYDYRLTRNNFLSRNYGDYTVYRGVTPSWDNTARRRSCSHVLWGSSPGA